MTIPYYERTLESFSDDMITRCEQSSNGLFYAVLDTPNNGWAWPDFSKCAKNREDAIRKCAMAIRQNAYGIGKYAPNAYLIGYHFRFVLAKRWTEKELTTTVLVV